MEEICVLLGPFKKDPTIYLLIASAKAIIYIVLKKFKSNFWREIFLFKSLFNYFWLLLHILNSKIDLQITKWSDNPYIQKYETCLCHELHNFAEYVRDQCYAIEHFITKFKKLLKHNSKNKKIFENVTNLPGLIRYGTWINSAMWLYANLIQI